jgi:hypothetical protein
VVVAVVVVAMVLTLMTKIRSQRVCSLLAAVTMVIQ